MNAIRIVAAVFLATYLGVFAVPHGASAASERILLYDSKAVFDSSGAMEVTEKITVRAAGNKIKRGIFRTLPRMWNREDGKRFAVEYTVKGVTLNGKPEPYTVTRSTEYVRVRAGSKDKILAPGVYEYAITYVVRNHFSRFQKLGWDELYWNVTGNEWEFPIDKARFSLSFRDSATAAPRPIPFKSVDIYTGRVGQKKQGATIAADKSVVTTTPLARGEGLTVAYTWPLSLLADVPAPVEYNLLRTLFVPRGKSWVLCLVPLWILGYFIYHYRKVETCRLPEVIPLFKVPDGLQPGLFRFVTKRVYDDTAFAADLLNLVAKGAVSLAKGPKHPILKKGSVGRHVRHRMPQTEEVQAMDRLFAAGSSVSLSQSNRKYIREAKEIFTNWCTNQKDTLLVPTRRIIFLGAAQILLLPLLSGVLFSWAPAIVFIGFAVFSFFWLGILLSIFFSVIDGISDIGSFFGSWPFIIFLLPFFIAYGGFAWGISTHIIPSITWPDGFFAALTASVLLWGAAVFLFPRRTPEGQMRYAQAKGLAMYLGTAERERFAALYPPAESVEHFEEMLPYALALDKGKTWANRFAKYLEEADVEADAFSDSTWDDIRRFRSSTSRSMTSPASRFSGGGGGSSFGSGSGGGGSSGRGSGGGGGGGW